MRIRAVAAPSDHSNAVGSLELECTPEGLLLVYLGLGAYSEGYATGALTEGTRHLIPWGQVEEVRATARHVLLKLSPRATPHHSLCLTHFSSGDAPPAAELKRRRRILWFATAGLMLAVLLSIAAQAERWSVDRSQLGALAIGALAAIAVLVLGFSVERMWISPRESSEEIQRGFLTELAHYRPKPVLFGEPERPASERLHWPDLIHWLPRSTFAIIIVFTAAILALVLTSSRLLQLPDAAERRSLATRSFEPPPAADEPVPPAATAAPDPSPPAEAAPAATATERLQAGAPCTCERADSALWSLQFPRLSTLLIEQRSRPHEDHHHLDIELAVINNSADRLDEVNLLVQFYEDDGKKPTQDRPLHYGSPLRPGQAIKWSVSSRGTSFTVQNPRSELLDDDPKALAGADAFAALLNANHRPVRLHGAMMLAYLGDERAKGGALRLRDALRESEAPYLDRVLAAQSDVITCAWRASESGRVRQISACVFNASGQRQSRLGVVARALDRVFDYRNPTADPPRILAEKLVDLDGELEPGQGVQSLIPLDTDNPDGHIPAGFEVFADRRERL